MDRVLSGVLITFAVAALLLVAFLLIERRHPDPLVPLRIFKNRSLSAADGSLLVIAAALFGVFFFCTLYLQQVLGYSALRTGVSYLPLSLSLIFASALASRLVDRLKTPKPVLSVGLLIATVGFVLLTRISGHSDYWSHLLPAMIVLGVGLGLSFVPITIAATSGVAAADSGLASGLLNTTQQVGGSLGLAILSSISTSRSSVRSKMSATSAITPRSRKTAACFSPRPSMSIAPLETKCLTCCQFWPGQPVRFGQIVQTPSSGLTVGVSQAGQRSGGVGTGPRSGLRWACGVGETTRGITSPARVTTTSSPSRTSLRTMSCSL